MDNEPESYYIIVCRYIICKWDHGQWHMTHWLAGSMIYEQNNNVDTHKATIYDKWEMDMSCGVGHLGFSIYTEYEILYEIIFMHHFADHRYLGFPIQKKQSFNQNSSKNNFTYFPIRSNVKTVSLCGSHVGFLIHKKS